MRKFRKAFTLIELLVVVAIIGILAAIVIINVTGARAKAARAKVESDMATVNSIAAACVSFGKMEDMYDANFGDDRSEGCVNGGAECIVGGSTQVCHVKEGSDLTEISAQTGPYPILPTGYTYTSADGGVPAVVTHTVNGIEAKLTCDNKKCVKSSNWDSL